MTTARFTLHLLLAPALIAAPLISFGESSDDWTFTVAPYVWATGLEGKVATLPPAAPAEIDLSFSDVLDNLDMTLMGLAEARKGRFGLFGEVFYVDITADAKTPGPFYSGAGYEQDLWALSVGGSYAVLQGETKHIDVVAGLRYWDLDNEIDLDAGAAAAAKRSKRESWTDFFVGAKGKVNLNQRWYLSGWAVSMVAGDSDSAWDVMASVGYEINDDFSLTLGYRHQEVDYRKGDFLFDVELSGPIIGLVFGF